MNWANVRHQERKNLIFVRGSDLLEICRSHLRGPSAPFSLWQETYLLLASVVKSGPPPLCFLLHPICR